MTDYFQHKKLLSPPIRRAAYSDRTAWLMAEMSSLVYLRFERNGELLNNLKAQLLKANFDLFQTFNRDGTQGFLAKRDSDRMAVLAFRGTEKEDPRDIIADLNARFYVDDKGVRVHDGFYRAIKCVEKDVARACGQLKDYSLYVTGHSLGGALALIATRVLNSDNLAACYTFGSPMVGCKEFDDEIKPPIYRIVNAYDIVPFAPPSYFIDLFLLVPIVKLQRFLQKFKGYEHHGDMRFLSHCKDDLSDLDIISNYNDLFRLFHSWRYRKQALSHHAIRVYGDKLAYWALKRLDVK